MRRIAPIIVVLAAGLLARLSGDAASPAELDLALAREPAEVVATSGRAFRGTLDGFRDGRLHLRLATDGGEVGYSFAPSEITRFTPPGATLEAEADELLERGRIQEALPLLEALGRHRIRYLAVLGPERCRVLWQLMSVGPEAGDAHGILGIARAMRPLANTPELERRLIEAELLVHVRLQSTPGIEALAGRWCAVADPSGDSALGWRVLARIARDAGDFERARWIALQPVTFSGHLGMRDLDHCYALAIEAADRLGDTAHAAALHREMQARGIAWPRDPALAALGAHYALTAPPGGTSEPHAHFPPAPPAPTAQVRPAMPVSSIRIHQLVGPTPAPAP